MKKALVTGCSSGFGKEIVKDLLADGWFVFATMRNLLPRGQKIFDYELNHYEDRLEVLELDVQKKSDIENIKKIILNKKNQTLDLLVNNAGFALYTSLENASVENLEEQMDINFFGSALLTRELLPCLRKSDLPRIIFISSIMGACSMPLSAMYSASKFAIEGLAEGLFYELKSQGVQVCSIRPGAHRTNFMNNAHMVVKNNEYKALEEGFLLMTKRLKKRKKASGATAVSSKLIKLLKRKKLPRSAYVGFDAKILSLMKRILPESLYLKITYKMYSKLLGL